MPSPNERQRNNIRTGVFMIVTTLLAISIVVVLSGQLKGLLAKSRTYTVNYNVAQGVSNLKSGADVFVGGFAMGHVTEVAPDFDDKTLENIVVTFELDERITMHEGAKVYIKSALIGADAWIEIPNLGDPNLAVIEASLDGATPLGMLAQVLGPAGEQKTQQILDDVAITMAHASSLSEQLDGDWESYDGHLRNILQNADATASEVHDVVSAISGEDWPQWSARIHDVMAWTADFTANLDATVDEGRNMLADSRKIVGRNAEQVDRIIDNLELTSDEVQAIAGHFNRETLVLADALLSRAREGVDSAMGVLETMNQRRERWASDISETLVNANLMSIQLKLVSEEIRRSPWKLLHRPSDSELEHELLYAAARSFAVATADLKAASESAESILANHSDALDDRPDLRERLQADLIESLDRFEAAQARMLEVIQSGAAP